MVRAAEEVIMPKTLLILAALVSLATAAAAQDGAQVSVGYAFLKYLETDGDNTPTGAYLSVSGGGRTTLELDAGYHRKSEPDFSLNTFTLLAGPKFSPPTSGSVKPYLHLLGGVRHDRVKFLDVEDSNTAPGGMAGVGVDIHASKGVGVRLGADFQLFRDEGENLKSLRLNAGLTF
jgi:opacity protein-like surface antigen